MFEFIKSWLIAIILLPIAVAIFVLYEIITWSLKHLKLMKWDYVDYINYTNEYKVYNDDAYIHWKQESFYKIRIDCGILNDFGVLIEMIPMFSNKVYLTVDDNPVDTLFSKPIITPGTIKTNIWDWHIHKEELLHELKLKRNEIRKQEIEGDFE